MILQTCMLFIAPCLANLSDISFHSNFNDSCCIVIRNLLYTTTTTQFTTCILLKCPITTALFKKDEYDLSLLNVTLNSVIDIVYKYNTDVIIPIAKSAAIVLLKPLF